MQDDLIKQAMALLVEDDADASRIATAATTLMRSLHDELALLVGAQAANALYVHALHRTRAILYWSLPPTAAIDDNTLLALRADLATRTPQEALFASTTLLVALIDHLIALIGQPLMDRMLSSAWKLPAHEQTLRENFK